VLLAGLERAEAFHAYLVRGPRPLGDRPRVFLQKVFPTELGVQLGLHVRAELVEVKDVRILKGEFPFGVLDGYSEARFVKKCVIACIPAAAGDLGLEVGKELRGELHPLRLL